MENDIATIFSLRKTRLDPRCFPYARTTHVSKKKPLNLSNQLGNKYILHTCQTQYQPQKKETHMPNPWPFIVAWFFSHSFHHFSPPWRSQVGDSLEPQKAIGFSPPSEPKHPPIFRGGRFLRFLRNCGKLVKFHPQKWQSEWKNFEWWTFFVCELVICYWFTFFECELVIGYWFTSFSPRNLAGANHPQAIAHLLVM